MIFIGKSHVKKLLYCLGEDRVTLKRFTEKLGAWIGVKWLRIASSYGGL